MSWNTTVEFLIRQCIAGDDIINFTCKVHKSWLWNCSCTSAYATLCATFKGCQVSYCLHCSGLLLLEMKYSNFSALVFKMKIVQSHSSQIQCQANTTLKSKCSYGSSCMVGVCSFLFKRFTFVVTITALHHCIWKAFCCSHFLHLLCLDMHVADACTAYLWKQKTCSSIFGFV